MGRSYRASTRTASVVRARPNIRTLRASAVWYDSRAEVACPMTSIESARALYARTRRERFALGAFNVDNQETLIAIARAAARQRSPVLVEASHGEVEMIGLRNLRSLVTNYRVEYDIEMYINLDHSPSVEAARAGVDAGF